MLWGCSRSPSTENPGAKTACAESNPHSRDLGAELAREKMKIIGDFSREQLSKAPHPNPDVGEPVWVKNRAISSKGGGEGSVVQPSRPKNGVPAPCATLNKSICPRVILYKSQLSSILLPVQSMIFFAIKSYPWTCFPSVIIFLLPGHKGWLVPLVAWAEGIMAFFNTRIWGFGGREAILE